MRKLYLAVAASAAAFVLMGTPAHAGTLDDIITTFQGVSTGWQGPLREFATRTFGLLSLISLALAGFKLAFRNADLGEWMAELVNQILFLGFFLLLLENSVDYGLLIIQSFRLAASQAGGTGMSPTDVFNAGLNLASVVYSQSSFIRPERSLALIIAAMVVVICYALIAAEMLVALIESYVVISASVLFMAMGGLTYTKEIAISVLRYTFSVGAKLFILQLLVSTGKGIINQAVQSFTVFSYNAMFTVIGCSIVLLVLVRQLPTTLQGIINGSHSVGSGTGLIGAAAFVTSTAVAVGAAALGTPVAAAQAARLAHTEISAKDEKSGKGRGMASKAAGIAFGTIGNTAKAAASDVGRRLAGQSSGRGSAPWRMAADLGNRRRLVDEDRNKPQPPAPASNSSNTIS